MYELYTLGPWTGLVPLLKSCDRFSPMASPGPFSLNKFSLFSFSDGHFGDLGVVNGNSPSFPTPSALSLAGDHQISCASMVRCNNLGVSQKKAALDINVLWSGRSKTAGPLVCVCVFVRVCKISFMTGALVHQRDVLFFCSPQKNIPLSYRGRIRWPHSFRHVWSKGDGMPQGAVLGITREYC